MNSTKKPTSEQALNTLRGRLNTAFGWRGISQKELAKEMGITPHRISNALGGDNPPSISMLVMLANALNVTPDWLLGYADDVKRGEGS